MTIQDLIASFKCHKDEFTPPDDAYDDGARDAWECAIEEAEAVSKMDAKELVKELRKLRDKWRNRYDHRMHSTGLMLVDELDMVISQFDDDNPADAECKEYRSGEMCVVPKEKGGRGGAHNCDRRPCTMISAPSPVPARVERTDGLREELLSEMDKRNKEPTINKDFTAGMVSMLGTVMRVLSRHPASAGESLAARPKVVCLCGSTRFMRQFFEIGWDFTLKGYIVLSVGVCKHADKDGAHGAEALGQDVADRLDTLHLRKIDMADEVFIINIGGYIGESTARELAYAIKHGKQVSYLEPPDADKRDGGEEGTL